MSLAIIYQDDKPKQEEYLVYEPDLFHVLLGAYSRDLGVDKDCFFRRLRGEQKAAVKLISSSELYPRQGPRPFHGSNDHRLENLSIIEGHTNIKHLEITPNFEICSLDGISSLINLESLMIGMHCQLQDLHGLEFCSQLTLLQIPNNDVSDLSPINDHSLRSLDISHNPIESLVGLNLSHLKTLVLSSDQCRLIKNLEMPALQELRVKGRIAGELGTELVSEYGDRLILEP